MSSTSVKNFRLSQPLAGQVYVPPTPILVSTSTTSEECETIKIEIPGVDPADVDVSCEGTLLIVRCEKGEYTQQLDPRIDTSEVKADIKWGMLTLTIPAAPVPASRTIKVSVHDAVSTHAKKMPVKAGKTEFTEEIEG